MADPNKPPADPATSLPEQFGRYIILSRLGGGGMGAVYLAEDSQLGRRVALKVPSFGPEEGEESRNRFLEEARAAATLDHPSLCPVYDVGEVDGRLYLTMAYIEGKSLAEIVRSEGMPERQVAALVGKLAVAMQEAHARGIIHRDLKPANIMIRATGGRREPVIVDFGLARREASDDVRLTRTGQVMGTLGYMAPEQVRGESSEIGPACDVYAMGVILYELLTGRLPFRGSGLAVAGQILTQEPLPISSHRADVDPRLEAICRKAMAKAIADRYASMKEMAAAFAEFLSTAPSTEVSPPPLASGSGESPSRVVGSSSLVDQLLKSPSSEGPGPPQPPPAPVPDEATPVRSIVAWAKRKPKIVATAGGGVLLLGLILLFARGKSDPPSNDPAPIARVADVPPRRDEVKAGPRWVTPRDRQADAPPDPPAKPNPIPPSNPAGVVIHRSPPKEVEAPKGPVPPPGPSPGRGGSPGRGSGMRGLASEILPSLAPSQDGQPVGRGGMGRPARQAAPERPINTEAVEIFNGKDVADWKSQPSDGDRVWTVKTGLLHGVEVSLRGASLPTLFGMGREYQLYSPVGDYKNFHLTARVEISDGGRAGIDFRCPAASGFSRGGYEVIINSTGRDRNRTGSLARQGNVVVPILTPLVKPAKWCTVEVEAVEKRIVVWVDKKKCVDWTDETGPATKGHIALHLYGNSHLVVRKVEIREIDPAKPEPPVVPKGVGSAEDPLQAGTTWVQVPGTGVGNVRPSPPPIRIQITERQGENFTATWRAQFTRTIRGTIRDGEVHCLAKDTTPAKGDKGLDVDGTIKGDTLTLTSARDFDDGHEPPNVSFTLKQTK